MWKIAILVEKVAKHDLRHFLDCQFLGQSLLLQEMRKQQFSHYIKFLNANNLTKEL